MVSASSSVTQSSFFSRVKNFGLKVYNTVSSSPTAIQVGTTVALLAIPFFQTFQTQVASGTDIFYAVARGGGSALKYVLAGIFTPTLRTGHAKVHEHFPALVSMPLIGRLFHHRMSLHKFLGGALLATAGVHTIAHCARHSVSLLSQESITGITMLALTILPIASMYFARSSQHPIARPAREQSYYLQFLLPHQIGWWGLVGAFAMHTKDFRLLPWSVSAFCLFGIDRVWEWTASRDVSIINIERIHNDLIVIETKKPKDYAYKSGQKAYISYPAATAFVNMLHPFTIASAPEEDVLRFVVSVSGQWTRKLVDTITNGDVIRLSPAYPSPLDATSAIDAHSDRLFITSGAGIAMTLAHLNDTKKNERSYVIHTTRNREEFKLLNRYIAKPRCNVIAAEYYDTSTSFKSRLRSQHEPRNATTSAGRFTPSENQILAQFKGRVFYCGNESLGNALEKTLENVPGAVLIKEKFNF